MHGLVDRARIIIRHISSDTIFLTSSNSSSRSIFNESGCWNDSDYQLWKQGKYFPVQKLKDNIVYMAMTGNIYLRSRCDVIMCTVVVTLHQSRLLLLAKRHVTAVYRFTMWLLQKHPDLSIELKVCKN